MYYTFSKVLRHNRAVRIGTEYMDRRGFELGPRAGQGGEGGQRSQ